MHKISGAVVTKAFTEQSRNKKVILLDIDDTLYAYEHCHRYALQAAYTAYRQWIEAVSFNTFLKAYASARKKVNRRLKGQGACHSRLLYFQTMLESRMGQTDCRRALQLEKAYWKAFLSQMRLASWVGPFLRWCKAEGKRVVIVTNLTTEIQMYKLLALKLGKKIDFLVTSEEAGVEKPHPAIYRLALQKAGCSPSQALVIGDNTQLDRCSFLPFVRVAGPKRKFR